MAEIPVFPDKTKVPDFLALNEVLGDSYKLWDKATQFVTSEIGNIHFEWKHYGKNSGWTLKVLSKKRNLFFLLPCRGLIKLAFVFGQKATNEILESEFPVEIKKSLAEARVYAEGRGLQLEIAKESDLEVFRKLIAVKVNRK